jgi:hypothetical protein
MQAFGIVRGNSSDERELRLSGGGLSFGVCYYSDFLQATLHCVSKQFHRAFALSGSSGICLDENHFTIGAFLLSQARGTCEAKDI